MTRADRLALLFNLFAVIAGYLVTDLVFERLAHIEDEIAYLWQAQAVAGGHLTVPSPPEPKSFLVPFVVDYQGQRFSKYPLGWPVVLAIGVLLKARFLINPLLSGAGVWLTYRLGKMVFGEAVGLLAAGLTLTSPFFLMNAGSLLSHPLGLVLSTSFALAWLDAFFDQNKPRRWLPTLVSASSLGLLVLTRPLTALAVGLPFGLHGVYLLLRSNSDVRRRVAVLGLIVLALASLHFVWQFALTGDPFFNPYTLWWDYDRVGFGPGHGHLPGGHTLSQARINTKFSLWVGARDLFGWGTLSWIFLPFGLITIWRNLRALLVGSVFPSLLIVYTTYWIGSHLFGPRYYFEGLYSLTLLSSAGIAWLAGWPIRPGDLFPNFNGWRRARPLAITAIVSLLISFNLLFYTPMRLNMMFGLYGVQRSHIEPFLTPSAQELTPALVIVHTSGKWIDYGTLLDLEDPFLETPFILIISRFPEIDSKVAELFPQRSIFHYYPDQPYTFYTAPRP